MDKASISFLLLLGQILSAVDLSATFAHQESEVARAINAKDRAVLKRLTAHDFHDSMSYGSALHNVATNIERDAWVALMTSRDVVRCEIDSFRPRSVGPGAFYVEVKGALTLRSPESIYTRRRFESIDMWIWRSNTWKLVSRVSHVM